MGSKMKLEEIQSLWAEDAKIDLTKLDLEATNIPRLHSKYYQLYSNERLLLKKQQSDFKRLEHDKYEFYTQGPNETTPKTWVLPAKGVILKNEVDRYLSADPDLINMALRIEVQKEKVDFLYSIIDNINKRSFQLSNALTFMKWQSGN
jgi:hypothetical protein